MSENRPGFDSHFSAIASDYSAVRFTDPEPVIYIRGRLNSLSAIKGIELGCGTGRYTAQLFKTLGRRLSLHCIDTSAEMLACLHERLVGRFTGRHTAIQESVEAVNLPADTFDAVFSFNALHHFGLPQVLRNISAWLRSGRKAFLYTRTPKQNAQNLWGRFFPGFAEKEVRLRGQAALMDAVDHTPGLNYVEAKRFTFSRRADLSRILYKVDHYHYSTLRLYQPDEFLAARRRFVRRLKDTFKDSEDIHWTDQNLMLVVEKQ